MYHQTHNLPFICSVWQNMCTAKFSVTTTHVRWSVINITVDNVAYVYNTLYSKWLIYQHHKVWHTPYTTSLLLASESFTIRINTLNLISAQHKHYQESFLLHILQHGQVWRAYITSSIYSSDMYKYSFSFNYHKIWIIYSFITADI